MSEEQDLVLKDFTSHEFSSTTEEGGYRESIRIAIIDIFETQAKQGSIQWKWIKTDLQKYVGQGLKSEDVDGIESGFRGSAASIKKYMAVLYWLAAYGDQAFDEHNIKLDGLNCNAKANAIIGTIWTGKSVPASGSNISNGEPTPISDNTPWGVEITDPFSLAEPFYFIEMDDGGSVPNENTGKVEVKINLRLLIGDHDSGFKFGFSKAFVEFRNLDRTRARLEFNDKYWATNRKYNEANKEAEAHLFSSQISPYIYLWAINDKQTLNSQFRFDDDWVFAVCSSKPGEPYPKISASLRVHSADLIITETPNIEELDGDDLDEAKKAIIGRLLEEDTFGNGGPMNTENEMDNVVLVRHTASVNCYVIDI